MTLTAGALVVAAGYGLGVVLLAEIWQPVLVSSLIGAGIGLAYGAMPALIMGAVPVAETAVANSLNTLMRAIGTSVSSAVSGVVLAHLTVRFGPAVVPSQGAFRLVLAIASARRWPPSSSPRSCHGAAPPPAPVARPYRRVRCPKPPADGCDPPGGRHPASAGRRASPGALPGRAVSAPRQPVVRARGVRRRGR
ncbi:hypothetical protein [Actinocatenispora rupis]|uniref:Major Facilitator Superfamily protein n=1 Tax=Actinocatenispora rupis TaxID=519421 RepID=A0A8J3J8M2_9ACTN|nr:hypothetical protein [Actinocatenispora rupis]GID12162.1 hypothetical protein Aru02nite_30510 [Actinocatenispora rupis]